MYLFLNFSPFLSLESRSDTIDIISFFRFFIDILFLSFLIKIFIKVSSRFVLFEILKPPCFSLLIVSFVLLKKAPPGWFEHPTYRLTAWRSTYWATRASRHYTYFTLNFLRCFYLLYEIILNRLLNQKMKLEFWKEYSFQ